MSKRNPSEKSVAVAHKQNALCHFVNAIDQKKIPFDYLLLAFILFMCVAFGPSLTQKQQHKAVPLHFLHCPWKFDFRVYTVLCTLCAIEKQKQFRTAAGSSGLEIHTHTLTHITHTQAHAKSEHDK